MAGDCEEDEDVVVPEVRRKVAMGREVVLLWVCAGCVAAFIMVIVLDRITGDEVDADLDEDLIKATMSA
jgi:hypothetical protein